MLRSATDFRDLWRHLFFAAGVGATAEFINLFLNVSNDVSIFTSELSICTVHDKGRPSFEASGPPSIKELFDKLTAGAIATLLGALLGKECSSVHAISSALSAEFNSSISIEIVAVMHNLGSYLGGFPFV